MKKLSKSLFTFLLVAVLAMSFTACGKNQGTSEQTTENAASHIDANTSAPNDANTHHFHNNLLSFLRTESVCPSRKT